MNLYRFRRRTLLSNKSGAPISGIKAWYQAEKDTRDSVDAANGTAQGSLTYATGVFGQAFSLDGSTAYVRIPYSSVLASTTAQTLMAWIYMITLPSAGNYYHIFGQSTSGNDNDFIVATSTLQFYGFPTASAVSSTLNLSAGVWTHVAATCSSSLNVRALYINGNQVGVATCTARLNSTADWSIGESLVNTGRKFYGLIDDVRMYNIALTQAQIRDVYTVNDTKGLLRKPRYSLFRGSPTTYWNLRAWLKADGNITDSTGNIATSAGGTITYTTGAYGLAGQAFNFTGSSYVILTYNSYLYATTQETMMCWLYLNALTGIQTVMAQSTNGNDNDMLFNSTTLQFYGFGSTLNCTQAFSLSVWYHVCIVVDTTTNTKTFYVNGIAKGSTTATARANSTNNYSIGESLVFTGRRINARIDDARVYNKPLTQAQVQTCMTGSPLYES